MKPTLIVAGLWAGLWLVVAVPGGGAGCVEDHCNGEPVEPGRAEQ